MQYIFISYSTKDGTDFANLLRHELKNRQIDTWMAEDIGIADDWTLAIDQKIEEACAIVIVMTQGSKLSENVTYEWAYALGLKKKIITILREDIDLHYKLRDLQRVDFRSSANRERPWSLLFEALEKILHECDERSTQNIEAAETQIDQQDFSDLLDKLRDPDIAVKADVVRTLGRIQARGAVPGLIKLLEDRDEWTRSYAIRALAKIGDTKAVEKLADLIINDPEFIVRAEAAEALGQIGGTGASPALKKALRDSTVSVRAAAVRALGKLKDKTAVSEFRRLLHDPGNTTRAYAAEALGIMQDKKSVPDIITTSLNYEDSYVRGYAAEALGSIADKSAVAALIDHLSDDDLWFTGKRVSDAAADALVRIGTPEALAVVEEWQRKQQNQQ